MSSFLVGTLEFGKIIISVFAMCYAYFFLVKCEDHDEKKPWQYLFLASMFLFLVELVSTLQFFKGDMYNLTIFDNIQEFVEFAFLIFFLFSFIYQHHLLVMKNVLIIKKKEGSVMGNFKEKYLLLEKKAQALMKQDEDHKVEKDMKNELEELDDDFKEEEEQLEELVGKDKKKTKKKSKKTKKKKK